MGLKGVRLWVMGQLDSTCRAPPRVQGVERGALRQEHEKRVQTPDKIRVPRGLQQPQPQMRKHRRLDQVHEQVDLHQDVDSHLGLRLAQLAHDEGGVGVRARQQAQRDGGHHAVAAVQVGFEKAKSETM